MRLQFTILSLCVGLGLLLLENASAFQIQHSSSSRQGVARRWSKRKSNSWLFQSSSHNNNNNNNNNNNLHEFEYLLREDASSTTNVAVGAATTSTSRRRIVVPGSADSSDYRIAIMTSNTFAAPSSTVAEEAMAEGMYGEQNEASASGGGASEYDPFADSLESQLGKVHQFQEKQEKGLNIEGRLKQMDLQDIVVTFIIPAIAIFAGARWVFNRVANKVEQNAEATLDSFANDMIYHDGDFDEMKLCVDEFSRKLVWMGPAKTDAMLKRYLETYAKKKTVNPRAISSLSYVFTLFKLSEERAAQVLVSLCKQMGTNKISSAGKLLFFGSRILKSPEGKAALTPIKDLIKSTYRDASFADTMIETSQQAIAEAAYRSTVQSGGRNQSTLTIGWEVLGLDRETATRIWEEEKKEGFVTARETMYGLQTQKYDKNGNRITDEGKLENPEETNPTGSNDGESGDDDDDAPTSNVYECSDCGYTLFIAQGRESKFFGPSFKCPECGALKDKFKGRNVEEEDE